MVFYVMCLLPQLKNIYLISNFLKTCIGVWLIYNVVLVSGIQTSESARIFKNC